MAAEYSYPIEFHPSTRPDGFMCLDGPPGSQTGDDDFLARWLVEVSPRRDAGKKRHEIPDDLFLQFANLPCTEEAIVEFANGHGFLGIVMWAAVIEQPGGPVMKTDGESIAQWRGEIDRMNRARELWGAIKHRKIGMLKQWLRVANDTPIEHSSEKGWRVIYERGESIVAYARFDDGELAENHWTRAGRLVLQSMAQDALRDSTQMGIVDEKNGLSLKIVARSLLGMMWLQFMRNVSTGRVVECQVCSEPFVARGRVDKKICSPKCIQRRFREQHRTNANKRGQQNGKKTRKR